MRIERKFNGGKNRRREPQHLIVRSIESGITVIADEESFFVTGSAQPPIFNTGGITGGAFNAPASAAFGIPC